VEYNPFARDTQTNPYPVYHWLRDQEPVHHNPDLNFYALSRFDDVLKAHLDPGTFLSNHGPTIEVLDTSMGAGVLIAQDQPTHTWQRKLISRVFTPRAITQLEEQVRSVAGGILDDARERGTLDVIGEYSAYLPILIIAEMLGVPTEARAELRELSDRMLDRSEADGDAKANSDSSDAIMRFVTMMTELAHAKAANPTDDIASLLLTARTTDDEGNEVGLDPGVVPYRLMELIVAGHETTAKLIGNGVVALTWYRDQRQELVEDPGLIPRAVEEMLRWDPPSHYQGRWVEKEVTLHGVTIPPESRVVLITGSANHDERVFEEPELFSIHREFDRHVAFGFGIHLCVGAALARLETRVAFEELLRRYPDYELTQPMKRAYSSNVRGLSSLPIALGAA
jgi:cytochrome P450